MGMAQEIPDKLYYRIGEVAEITDVPAYVLRYWESEFKLLRPKKNEAGQRLYRRKEVDLILKIKSLLYEERLTLEGAKKRLAEDQKDRRQLEIGVRQAVVDATLRRLRQRLDGLRARLSVDRPR
ncbi:MAG TPA: MerR family transcriptional regulator [Methylomirabilota bacterium]|nr:MerR family transcriptional regulator [Methylomirabilota bacterium]